MKVSDILRVKGNTLYTVQPGQPLMEGVTLMAEKDIGSLVVMDQGKVKGMLTFREVIQKIVGNGGQVGGATVRDAMEGEPLTCSSDTDTEPEGESLVSHLMRRNIQSLKNWAASVATARYSPLTRRLGMPNTMPTSVAKKPPDSRATISGMPSTRTQVL